MTTVSAPDVAITAAIDRESRRALVAADTALGLTGIDRVEVLSNLPDTADHVPGVPSGRTLLVWLIRGQVPDDFGADGVQIIGGVRIDPAVNPVRVLWAHRADVLMAQPPAGITEADVRLVRAAVQTSDPGNVLVVRTSSTGDWSSYVLRLIIEGAGATGSGYHFDPPLTETSFSFKVDCPSDLDCRDQRTDAPAPPPTPILDYLARDYDALRVRLLDRLSALLPEWSDRSPADPLVTLVELFASVGDRLSFWQDAVATEAYLGTARRRTSVRRHVRLLDYRLHEGCSARTWLAFTVSADVTVRKGNAVCDLHPPGVSAGALPAVTDAVDAGAVVFETRADASFTPARNHLWLHSWRDPEHALAVGATAAFVACEPGQDPRFRAGDVVILTADVDPGTDESSVVSQADPGVRHAVRLISEPVRRTDAFLGRDVLELRWSSADALPFPIPVTRRGADGEPQRLAAVLGNVVQADHGGTITDDELIPAAVPMTGTYRPRLRNNPVSWIDPSHDPTRDATAALLPDARRALPTITLHDGQRMWKPRLDLLASQGQAAHVVVEADLDGTSTLRFGDGLSGRRPDPATTPRATYRVGTGSAGNVAADVLTTMLSTFMQPGMIQGNLSSIRAVVNPIAARGGTDPESLSEARELAPRAFREQQRAVTPADYAAIAMRHPAVQSAVARRRWTGSWYKQEVTIDPIADRARDISLIQEVSAALSAASMAGVDVSVVLPAAAPLEIVLRVHIMPGYLRSEVGKVLADRFSAVRLPGGLKGFFHQDNFTFGQSLFLSDVVAAAMSVPGVDWVEVDDEDATGLRFRRLGQQRADEVARGRIDIGTREVLRADSDPSNPENGRVEFQFRGGS